MFFRSSSSLWILISPPPPKGKKKEKKFNIYFSIIYFLARLCSQGGSDGNHSNNEEHIIKFGSIIEYCNACTTQPGFSSSHAHHQPSAAGSPLPQSRPDYQTRTRILDPRCVFVQKLNRVLLLARGIALAVDPLFFYVFSLYVAPGRGGAPCVYMDAELALIVTVIRTCVDVVHLWHLWLQFRLAYVSRESLVVGCGKLVWDARAIARHYVMSPTKFWLDVFVILPIPQVSCQPTFFWISASTHADAVHLIFVASS